MSNIKDFLGSLLSGVAFIIFYAVMLWFEFGGIYHSFQKHSDGWVSVFVPPLAWYRAVEIIWHDDYSGINWDNKLKKDLEISTYFLNAYTEKQADIYILNNEIEEFSSIIIKYPDEKLNYLKRGTKSYIIFNLELSKDISKCINTRQPLQKSESTKKYETELRNIYHMELYSNAIDSLISVINDKGKFNEPTFTDNNGTQLFRIANEMYKTSYLQTFEKIFHEKLDL